MERDLFFVVVIFVVFVSGCLIDWLLGWVGLGGREGGREGGVGRKHIWKDRKF